MKFDEIPAPCIKVRIKSKSQGKRLRAGDVQSITLSAHRGEFDLYMADSTYTVVPTSPADINRLTDALSTGRANLAQLCTPAHDNSFELNLYLFSGEQLSMGNLEIGIDEHAISALKKTSLEEAARVLWGKSILKHNGKSYFFIVAGEAAKTYLEKRSEDGQGNHKKDNLTPKSDSTSQEKGDDAPDEESTETPTYPTPEPGITYRNFAILGSDIRFALAEKNKSNGDTIFLASKISKNRNCHQDPALRLASGDLKFLDWTSTGERAFLAKAQLDKILKDDSSYLKKWDEFGNIEGKLFLERARDLGAISFSVERENKDGTTIVKCGSLSDNQKEVLSSVTELNVVETEDIPPFLTNPKMTFTEYAQGISDEEETEAYLGEKKQRQIKRQKQLTTIHVDGFNPSTGQLRLRTPSAPDGTWLIYPIAGEVAQIKRRMNARTQILNGRAANPALGLLIEENGEIPPGHQPPKIKAMTSLVLQKVFPQNPPTSAQEQAIEVALNTPDIALIQGPPGTGKTTVIAAIIERLNQEADKRGKISGQVLLSGFQHDAVENMIERMTLNGLPVPKFGQRSRSEENADLSHFETQLQEWCQEIASALRKKNENIDKTLKEKKIRYGCAQYIKAPTLSLGITVLESALDLPDRTLGETLRKELQEELKKLKTERENEVSENPKLPIVRGIRVTQAGFSDDGPARAADALYLLKNEICESDKALLTQASHWFKQNEVPPFLQELKKFKRKLLIRFTPAPVFRAEKPRDTIISLIKKTLDRIKNNGLSVRDKKAEALSELLMEMENNPSGFLDTVKDYSFAFAATCQQSVNSRMREMKGLAPNSPDQKLEYDFVIVDEAARVSPRDLMIPMSQGKRIILVGDHRQLPQLIDEDVAKRLENETETGTEKEWLKKSMFEYLFTERIPKLEHNDGIKRHVTLDKQYRTHPLLGEFISRNFYERFNPDEKFESGLPEELFAQDLPGTQGKCAVWFNVPLTAGRMVPEGTSWTRPAEADTISQKLKAWIQYDNDRKDEGKKKLSFGVIAFYKAQAELVKKRLGSEFIESVGEKRLRIGTVDSFQGMEFDVVFLSPVRTGKKSFGFLQLYNRLNVSMSRQKKLLVVVGDAGYYGTEAAQEKVPGLADFLHLCQEKGVYFG